MQSPEWKAYGVNNLTDARFFNSLPKAWITFQMDALAEGAISLGKAKEIIAWLHEPNLVAAFGEHQDEQEIRFMLEELGIQHPEISVFHPLAMDKSFAAQSFIECTDDEVEEAVVLPHQPFAWVVDVALASPDDGTLVKQLRQLLAKAPLFLYTSLNMEEIKAWLKVVPEAGIQVNMESEEKPGFSNVDVYAEVIDAIGGY